MTYVTFSLSLPLSPSLSGYAHMTRMLMGVGAGRVAMALEGGYELMSLCASAEACMRALLGDRVRYGGREELLVCSLCEECHSPTCTSGVHVHVYTYIYMYDKNNYMYMAGYVCTMYMYIHTIGHY